MRPLPPPAATLVAQWQAELMSQGRPCTNVSKAPRRHSGGSVSLELTLGAAGEVQGRNELVFQPLRGEEPFGIGDPLVQAHMR